MGKPTIDEIIASDLAANENLPAVPKIDLSDTDRASTEYSQHRTKLSTHRTALSEHRTQLSKHRTDLSTERTGLSHRRTEMSSRRTGMSFQRTRLSAERTLMSVIRTSLSLISFGFTIYQFFEHLADKSVLAGNTSAARNFGAALVWLGVAMVIVGIAYHLQFMWGLRRERRAMTEQGLIHSQSRFPVSFTLLIALALLFVGAAALASLTFHAGPFD